MALNGHDRVTRYSTAANDDVFKALVGDDMNSMLESFTELSNKLQSYTARLLGVQISIMLLLAGVIFDLLRK